MNKPPAGWPRISSAVFYEDASKAIDWLCKAFGFEVRLRVEGDDGRIEHSELTFGDGVVMVATAGSKPGSQRPPCKSPKELGGANTQSLCVCVDDADAHCERARAAGARIVTEPMTADYGADYPVFRCYGANDLEGHHWWFMHGVRDPKPK
jgi:uncharacterized glyoxalase superfamily protein PhnB